MEKELKDLVEQLGSAIDETIAESGRIGDIVQEMEQAGYDLTLVLEATMRFTPKGLGELESIEMQMDSSMGGLTAAGPTVAGLTATAKFDLTPQDEEFLQALKVAF